MDTTLERAKAENEKFKKKYRSAFCRPPHRTLDWLLHFCLPKGRRSKVRTDHMEEHRLWMQNDYRQGDGPTTYSNQEFVNLVLTKKLF